MTFLDLCQRAYQECVGTTGRPTAVTGQTGDLLRVVNWVAHAYDVICAEHTNWRFLRSTAYVNTIANDEDYAPTEFTDSNLAAVIGSATVGKFASWCDLDPDTGDSTFLLYKQSDGVSTQQIFRSLPYGWFRQRYQVQPPGSTRPAEFTIRPRDNAIIVGPKPDAVYVVTGDYYRTAPPLVADGNEPLFPARFHMAIVWLAKRFYAGHAEDGGAWTEANGNYTEVMGGLEIDQLPPMKIAGPLA